MKKLFFLLLTLGIIACQKDFVPPTNHGELQLHMLSGWTITSNNDFVNLSIGETLGDTSKFVGVLNGVDPIELRIIIQNDTYSGSKKIIQRIPAQSITFPDKKTMVLQMDSITETWRKN